MACAAGPCTAPRPHYKVPRVTFFFWVIKLCCTTVGETISDAVNDGAGLGLGLTAAIFFPMLAIVLAAQLAAGRYSHPLYWGAVTLTSICGTIATDGLFDGAGVALWVEILVFGFLMVATFALWLWAERTLAIHSIYTLRREALYWWACRARKGPAVPRRSAPPRRHNTPYPPPSHSLSLPPPHPSHAPPPTQAHDFLDLCHGHGRWRPNRHVLV